jgi:hypothetical protein
MSIGHRDEQFLAGIIKHFAWVVHRGKKVADSLVASAKTTGCITGEVRIESEAESSK